jgi:photosystem II stability/assembly factor-like uncharacterized protein
MTKPISSLDGTVAVFVGTRKGAWIYRRDSPGSAWRVDGPHFLGHIANDLVLDPRDGQTLLMAAKTGHLGPTIFRSRDFGRTWLEAAEPPAFRKAGGEETALAVDHTFSLSPGHRDEPGVWYAGTSPIGLFRSEDGGARWQPVDGFNDHPMRFRWAPQGDETPDGPILHSILVDPRDPAHLYVNLSGGGTFETTDRGASWQPLNEGVEANFLPDPYPEYGQDPHCMMLHPLAPDRLYQANHCGIYRLDRPAKRWQRIGRNMPADVGDIGFPIVLHPRDPETAWVFPMDGTTVWPRTSPGGRPAAYRTRDGGATWERQDRGLPSEQGWFTVKRQAFACDGCDPLGLYFGTTGGELWTSANEGADWAPLAAHLPEIYSVTTAMLS